ncbi:glycosyltransferase family 52 [Myroides odoratimimus]|uniref:glycosyltransferase family 52 n=1 Tax=Myroides odoratimimus TaxID=76832 RepID=UPI003D2EE184
MSKIMSTYKEAIISWKYNDIFYGLSSTNVINRKDRLLIVIKSENYEQFIPNREDFGEILIFDYKQKSKLDLFRILYKVNQVLKSYRIETIYLSNAVLIINQFICKITSVKNTILLEDGLMNYYCFSASTNLIKSSTQFLLGLSDEKMNKKIRNTYVLLPAKAIYYKGVLKKLVIKDFSVSNRIIDSIKGKRILLGMPLYNKGKLSVMEYNVLVERLIVENNIDYYLPHLFCSPQEKIECNYLDLSKCGYTLEILASKIDFSIYSFGSSVSYSTKVINENITSVLIKTEYIDTSKLELIVETVDNIIEL